MALDEATKRAEKALADMAQEAHTILQRALDAEKRAAEAEVKLAEAERERDEAKERRDTSAECAKGCAREAREQAVRAERYEGWLSILFRASSDHGKLVRVLVPKALRGESPNIDRVLVEADLIRIGGRVPQTGSGHRPAESSALTGSSPAPSGSDLMSRDSIIRCVHCDALMLAGEYVCFTCRCESESEWGDDTKDQWSAEIEASFPTRSGAHEAYATAMRMVGNRRSKGALVALVTWLIVRYEAEHHCTKKEP